LSETVTRCIRGLKLLPMAGGSHVVGCSAAFMCFLSICLSVFPHDISKSDSARIIKLDTDMVHHGSWKSVCFGGQRSKVHVTRHKNNISMSQGSLVSAGFFYFIFHAFIWVLINFETGSRYLVMAANHYPAVHIFY